MRLKLPLLGRCLLKKLATLFFLLVLTLVDGVCAPWTDSRLRLNEALASSSFYMQRACEPSGRFLYRWSIAGRKQGDSYNIVRHAGAIYALAMLQRSRPEKEVGDTLVRAALFLQRNYIGPGIHPDQLVVWSKPLPQHSPADLGATGLGLVALIAVDRERPEIVPISDLEALGNYLLFMQRADGSFTSKFSPEDGPDEGFQSLYYPGEAALGLIDLYEIDHSQVWLNAAIKALLYLAKSRAALSDVPPDHWALIATAELLEHSSVNISPAIRKALIQHAVQICHELMKGQQRSVADPSIDGSFDPAGRTAPTATRMEGLLAALEFLPDESLRAQIKEAVDHGIAFLLRAQIRTGVYAGAMPNAVLASTPDAFYIRIDFVQHALCAFLRYQRLYSAAAESPSAGI